jgi:mono/diheme cytochrome c family protein
MLGALLVFGLSIALAAQNAREIYQRGLVQEHANGNLQAAIALYSQAAEMAGRDRALAARALIRIAESREKLGQRTEAANVYAEVVRAYPEQRAEVGTAQERLTVLRRTASAGTAKIGVSGVRDVSSVTAPFIASYCAGCHDARHASGGLDLGSLNAGDVAANTALWETIARRLQARHDPPAGAPRPDDRTYRSIVARIEQALDASYAASGASNQAERVTGEELASRIAALLWNDVPDAPLLAAARRGDLDDPAVLERQVQRMLRDAKSAALVSGFFADWLALDRLSKARPDPALFPRVDADLLQAMATETRLFLESQLREDRDAVELWTASYTYVNERLARHYGLSNVTGPEFRRVAWPDARRAGILGQAGPLAALSFPTRTSPTVRGSYVLTRFLGLDAPAPPANVPPLVEATPAVRPEPIRERMQEHKVNASCAGCHVMFDPLGFALENFDATGGWRTTDGGSPIDASGSFIDGTRFDGPAGLRAGLLKYRPAYYTAVTRRLLAYALNRRGNAGRVYDYEMAAVRTIVRDAAPTGYRWSSILAGISASAPFQMKRVVP